MSRRAAHERCNEHVANIIQRLLSLSSRQRYSYPTICAQSRALYHSYSHTARCRQHSTLAAHCSSLRRHIHHRQYLSSADDHAMTPSSSASSSSSVVQQNTPLLPSLVDDVYLERIVVTGYGPRHFAVYIPSALPPTLILQRDFDPTRIEFNSGFVDVDALKQQAAIDKQQAETPAALTADTLIIDKTLPQQSSAPVAVVEKNKVILAAANAAIAASASSTSDNDHLDINMIGSVFLTSNMAMHWRVNTWDDITIESLAIWDVLYPTPDLLLFGSGSTVQRLAPHITAHLNKKRIPYEVLDSSNAAGTFNMLSSEGRNVVCALLVYGDEADDEEKARLERVEIYNRPSQQARRRVEQKLLDEFEENRSKFRNRRR